MTSDRSFRWLPVAVGAVVFAAGVPLALSRDFGAFVVTAFAYVPALALAGVLLAVWFFIERRRRRKISIALAFAALFIAVPVLYLGAVFRDPIVFAFWAPTHTQLLATYATRDGIVMTWDEWGFAGLNDASYLVADHGDTMTSNGDATAWVKRHGGACEIVRVERMRRSFYILTTSECALER